MEPCMMTSNETTDIALFVRTSRQDIVNWDRRRIVDALVRETPVDIETAREISKEVERQIFASGISLLTAPLIRELVNAKLIERGLETAMTMHARLGFPLFDVGQLLLYRNKENAHVPHSPEGTNLTLAEGIKKEYAVLNVFSPEVGYAHMAGDLHIHDLGYIDRPYCSFQTLEYIKKYGLRLPNTLASAAPARHAETLIAHMVRFAAALQGNFSGAIVWDAVNLFFAPFCEGMSDGDITQCAQMLIYEFAQQAVARGGQTIYTDMNFYWEVPKHFEDVPAIGPGGTYTGKTYGEYAEHSQRFVRAVFDVFKKGDSTGKPFVFPQPIIHITDRFFQTPGHEDFLLHVCDVAGNKGSTNFVFDRGSVISLAECGGIDPASYDYAKTPWKMRYAAIQSVSINLPRLGYKSEGDESKLFLLIEEIMELSARAHEEKRGFIERLLSYGDDGPLSLLTMDDDGTSYLRMNDASYLIGMVGLNELVRIHTGDHLHESEDARDFGLRVICFMRKTADELSARRGMRFMLVQSLAESTAYRFARLDLKHFSPRAGYFVRGDISEGEVYYTNSTLLDVSSSTEPLEKAAYEGIFHPFIDGGAVTHIWLGAAYPSPASLARFIEQVFKTTDNRRVTFSPDFTTCMSCGRTARGLFDTCPFCRSDEVEGISKITGYFSKLSSWNKGKRAELRDRKHSGHFFR
ncbi:MAG: anaerobic ribonucleoside-triphosphate reductase [Deltaproteobacteria bacterium]|nr:anaerobic ribonucleoside-triphosphate reductase [Deltaproteobacteria bacterium]